MNSSAAPKLVISVVAALSTTLSSLPAEAQSNRTTAVRTSDLDLTTVEGERKLKLRLMHAISESCPIGAKCRDAALASAYKQASDAIAAAKAGAAVPAILRVPR